MEYKIEDRKPLCLECGSEIVYGRKDRKFCCDGCKNKYHNRMTHPYRNWHQKVVNRLDKNHEILERLLDAGLHEASSEELFALGYDTRYATSYRKVRRSIEIWCFDIRYNYTETRIFDIQKTNAPALTDL